METDNDLYRSIGFTMGVTYRRLVSLFQHWLKDYDITPEQWSVLYQIDKAEGIIQKVIAERSHKDKATTTRILDHLEEKGLIYKQRVNRDRRSFHVFTTEQGKVLMQATIPIERQINETVKQCVSEDEFQVLMELLRRIDCHLSQLLEKEKGEVRHGTT